MAKLLWEWKLRIVGAPMYRGLLLVTSHTNCDVTSSPVVMRRYAKAGGVEQRYKTSKTQVFLAFYKMVIVVEPSRLQAAAQRQVQLVLCRIAVPTTPTQTVSWSIPITRFDMEIASKDHGGTTFIRLLHNRITLALVVPGVFTARPKIWLESSRPWCSWLSIIVFNSETSFSRSKILLSCYWLRFSDIVMVCLGKLMPSCSCR